MFQNIYYDRQANRVHLWDDTEGYSSFPYKKYAYKVDPNGEFTTMDGLRVSKVSKWSQTDEEMGLMYEYDVPTTTRVLIDKYAQSDSISVNHRIMIFDIEVLKGERFHPFKDAKNVINAISYYLEQVGYVCFILDPDGRLEKGTYRVKNTAGKEITIKLFPCQSEQDLLRGFIGHWQRIRPTIVTGWNSDLFDVPYLINRINNVLGKDWSKKLSEIGIVYTDKIGSNQIKGVIAGVSCIDYMVLYKKFSEGDRARYKLDYIANLELGRGKKKYEKNLDYLYENDVEGFIEYNVDDVELIVTLDEKFDFIRVAQGLCHVGHCPYDNIYMPTMYIGGAALTECRRNGLIALTTKTDGKATKAKGAFVRAPRPGLYKYPCSVDLQSQYPTTIMTLNISPETKYGRILDWDESHFSKDVERTYTIQPKKKIGVEQFNFDQSDAPFTITNLREWMTEQHLCVSAIGVLYRIDKIGLIPSILNKWFAQRIEYKDARDKAFKNGDKDAGEHYDRLQYIQKILLNSFYGAMLEPNFRFYDKENGESTTQTGISLIKYTSKVINYVCRKITDKQNYDFIIYNDTDSAYFNLLPLVEMNHNLEKTDEEIIIAELQKYASSIEKTLNESYNVYTKKHNNLDSHRWVIKQEKIARRAFWGDKKKRYAMWVIVDEGKRVEKPMIKGFDSVRSDFPAAYRAFLEEIIIDILHDKTSDELSKKIIDFRYKCHNLDVRDIMPASSVKGISKYKAAIKSIPIHVRASMNYNRFLSINKLIAYPEIEDNDKIIWAYLKENMYKFPVLAIKGDEDPQDVVDFLETNIDRDQIFEKRMLSKLQPFWNYLGWGQVSLVENSTDFF